VVVGVTTVAQALGMLASSHIWRTTAGGRAAATTRCTRHGAATRSWSSGLRSHHLHSGCRTTRPHCLRRMAGGHSCSTYSRIALQVGILILRWRGSSTYSGVAFSVGVLTLWRRGGSAYSGIAVPVGIGRSAYSGIAVPVGILVMWWGGRWHGRHWWRHTGRSCRRRRGSLCVPPLWWRMLPYGVSARTGTCGWCRPLTLVVMLLLMVQLSLLRLLMIQASVFLLSVRTPRFEVRGWGCRGIRCMASILLHGVTSTRSAGS